MTNTRATVDGRALYFPEAVSPDMRVKLPEGNVLTGVAGVTHYTADGWVALSDGLSPGRHTFALHEEGSPGSDGPNDTTFYVNVRPAGAD